MPRARLVHGSRRTVTGGRAEMRRQWVGRNLPPLIAASAFGPYLLGGVKTDQPVVYLMALLTLPTLLSSRVWRFTWPLGAVVGGWFVLMTIAALQLVAPPPNRTEWGPGSWVANLDGFLLSLATLLVVVAAIPDRETWDVALRRVAAVVTVAMCLNALVAVAAAGGGTVPFAGAWAPRAGGLESTADRAATMGRFAGFIAQPAEAGILYGIACLCALLWLRKRPMLLAGALMLLTVGGFVAVSKAFLFVGLPIAAWHFLREPANRAKRVAALIGIMVLLWATIGTAQIQDWPGAEQLARQLPTGKEGALEAFTGNRYGDGLGLSRVVEPTLGQQPLFGFGMAGVGTATDAGWVQALVVAGVVGVCLLGLVMIGVAGGYRQSRTRVTGEQRRFLWGVVVIALVTSLGFPSLTGNRVAVIVWLVVGLMLVVRMLDEGGARRGVTALGQRSVTCTRSTR